MNTVSRFAGTCAIAAVALLPLASPAATFTESEIKQILSHGPWPANLLLETLSTFSNPWRPEDNGRCD